MDSRFMSQLERRAYERGNIPPPSTRVWKRGVFAATFGDSHVNGTDLEGGLIAPSLQNLSILLVQCIARKINMQGIGPEGLDAVAQLAKKCAVGAAFDKWDLYQVPEYIERYKAYLSTLQSGDYMVFPGGWRTHSGGHAVIYVIERLDEMTARFTVCNSGQGLSYHPQSHRDCPEQRHLTSLSIGSIPWKRLTDPGFIYSLVQLYTNPNQEPQKTFYNMVLPHLAGVPLAEAVARTEQVEDWDTPQRAGTCFYRCCLVALRYCLRRRGFSLPQVKTVKLALRLEQLHQCAHDLARGGDVEAEDRASYEAWKAEVLAGGNDFAHFSRVSQTEEHLRRLGVLPRMDEVKEAEAEGGAAAAGEDTDKAVDSETKDGKKDGASDIVGKLHFDMTPEQRHEVCIRPLKYIEDKFPTDVKQFPQPKDDPTDAELIKMPSSQGYMIHLALRQTAHAALKAKAHERITTEDLKRINAQLHRLHAYLKSDNVQLTGTAAQLPPLLELDTVSTTFRPLADMDLAAATVDPSKYAGPSKGDLPDPFVDLCDLEPLQTDKQGRPLGGSWSSTLALLKRTLEQCQRLERKATVTSAVIASMQRRALIEHVLFRKLPAPKPWSAERAAAPAAEAADAWTPEVLTLDEQRSMLSVLLRLTAAYMSSKGSHKYERLLSGHVFTSVAFLNAAVNHVMGLVPNDDMPEADADGTYSVNERLNCAGVVGQIFVGAGTAAARLSEVYAAVEGKASKRGTAAVRSTVDYFSPAAAALKSDGAAGGEESKGAAGEGDGEADDAEASAAKDKAAKAQEEKKSMISARQQAGRCKGTSPISPVAPVHFLDAISQAGFDLAGMSDTSLVTNPYVSVARGDLIQYYKTTKASNGISLFNYNSSALVFDDDSTLLFTKAVALAKGLGRRKPLGRFRPCKTDFERFVMWFLAGFENTPEFTAIRDMAFFLRSGFNADLNGSGEQTINSATPMWQDYFDLLPLPTGGFAAAVRVYSLNRSNYMHPPPPPHTLDLSTVCAFVEGIEDRTNEKKYKGPVQPGSNSWSGGSMTVQSAMAEKDRQQKTAPGTQLHRLVSEEDVLHAPRLPFNGVLSEQECEELMGFLTAPYVRIPLVLGFFGNNRLGALFDPSIRRLLERVLFEPLQYAPEDEPAPTADTSLEEQLLKTPISTVPLREDIDGNSMLQDADGSFKHATAKDGFSAFGTRLGLLCNELGVNPANVVRPLLEMAAQVDEHCTGSFKSTFVNLLAYILRILVEVEGWLCFMLQHFEGLPARSGAAPQRELQLWLKRLRAVTRGTLLSKVQMYIQQATEAHSQGGGAESQGLNPRAAPILSLTRLHSLRVLVFRHAGEMEAHDAEDKLHPSDAVQFLASAAQCVAWHSNCTQTIAEKALAKVPKIESKQQQHHWGYVAKDVARIERGKREKVYPTRDGLTAWVDFMAVMHALHAQRERALRVLQEPVPGPYSLEQRLNAACSVIVATANIKPPSLAVQWGQVAKTDLRCKQVVETAHPLVQEGTHIWHVKSPGAARLMLAFDNRTRMGRGKVTVYKNRDCTDVWGRRNITDDFGGSVMRLYGVGTTAPLIIPTDECFIVMEKPGEVEPPRHLPSQEGGTSWTDSYRSVWGFRITVEASIDNKAAEALVSKPAVLADGSPALRGDGASWPIVWAYKALADSNNDVTAALARMQQRAEESGGVVDAASTLGSGLFANAHGMELNLQTCEVYRSGRQLLPTPSEVRFTHAFQKVFPNQEPLCGIVEQRERCTTYSIDSEDHVYEVALWSVACAGDSVALYDGPNYAPLVDSASWPVEQQAQEQARARRLLAREGLELVAQSARARDALEKTLATGGAAAGKKAAQEALMSLDEQQKAALKAATKKHKESEEALFAVDPTPAELPSEGTLALAASTVRITEEQPAVNYPHLVDGQLTWMGQQFTVPYVYGSLGWVSDILEKCEDVCDIISPERLKTCDVLLVAGDGKRITEHYKQFEDGTTGAATLDSTQTEPPVLAHILVRAKRNSDDNYNYNEEAKSTIPLPKFVEIQVMRYRKEVRAFVLEETGHQSKRTMVFSTDTRWSMAPLIQASSRRSLPWMEAARFAGANTDAGSEYYQPEQTRSVITRTRFADSRSTEDAEDSDTDGVSDDGSDGDEDDFHTYRAAAAESMSRMGKLHRALSCAKVEQFVPFDMVSACVPGCFEDAYQFWRDITPGSQDGVVRFRGYPQKKTVNQFLQLDCTQQASGAWQGRLRRVTVVPNSDCASGYAISRIELLLDVSRADKGSSLFNVANVLFRLEGHVNNTPVWSEMPVEPQGMYQRDGFLQLPLCSVADGSDVAISTVELTAINASFKPVIQPLWTLGSVEDSRRVRLASEDFDGLYVSDARSDELAAALNGLPSSIVLENDKMEQFVMCVNMPMDCPLIVHGSPFSTELVPPTNLSHWHNAVNTRYYLYALHRSGAFVTSPSVAAALYLAHLALFSRDYQRAHEILQSCYKDSEFTSEELFMFNLVLSTTKDVDPDAHAMRLHCALIGEASGHFEGLSPFVEVGNNMHMRGHYSPNQTALAWQRCVAADVSAYLSKEAHVSTFARLSSVQLLKLLRLLGRRSSPIGQYLAAAADFTKSSSSAVVPPPAPGGLRLTRLPSRLNAKIEKGQLALDKVDLMSTSFVLGASGLSLPVLPKPGRYVRHLDFAGAEEVQLTFDPYCELPPGCSVTFYSDAELSTKVGPTLQGAAMELTDSSKEGLQDGERVPYTDSSYRGGQRVSFDPAWPGVQGTRPVKLFMPQVYVMLTYKHSDSDVKDEDLPIVHVTDMQDCAEHDENALVQAHKGRSSLDLDKAQTGSADAPFPFSMSASAYVPVFASEWSDAMQEKVDFLLQLERETAAGQLVNGPDEIDVSWLKRDNLFATPSPGDLFTEIQVSNLSPPRWQDLYQSLHDSITAVRPSGDGFFLSTLSSELAWPGMHMGRSRDWTSVYETMLNDVNYMGSPEISFFLRGYGILTGVQRLDMVKDTEEFHKQRVEAGRKQLAAAKAKRAEEQAASAADDAAPTATPADDDSDDDDDGGEEMELEWVAEMRQPGSPGEGSVAFMKMFAGRVLAHTMAVDPSDCNSSLAHVADRRLASAGLLLIAAAAEHDAEYPGATSFMRLLPQMPVTHEEAVEFVARHHNVAHPITKAQKEERKRIEEQLEARKGKTGVLASAQYIRQSKFPWRQGRAPRDNRRSESLTKDTKDLLQIAFEEQLFPALAAIASSAYFRVKYLRKPSPVMVLQPSMRVAPVKLRPEHLQPVKKLQPSDYAQRELVVPLAATEEESLQAAGCRTPLLDAAHLVAKSSSALDGVDTEASALNEMPFSLAHEAVAHSHSGKQFLRRMQVDLTKSKPPASVQDTLASIASHDVATLLTAATKASSIEELGEELAQQLSTRVPALLKDLLHAVQAVLSTLHSTQTATWSSARTLREQVANTGVDVAEQNEQFTLFEAQRFAGQVNNARLSFILGCMLSTEAASDLLRLNPFVDEAQAAEFVADSVKLMMKSVRASQAAHAMVELKGVLALTQEAVVEVATALALPALRSCAEHVLLPESALLSACRATGYDIPAAVQLLLRAGKALGSASNALVQLGESQDDADAAVMLWTSVTAFEEKYDFDALSAAQAGASDCAYTLEQARSDLPVAKAGACIRGRLMRGHLNIKEDPGAVPSMQLQLQTSVSEVHATDETSDESTTTSRVSALVKTLQASASAAAKRITAQRHYLGGSSPTELRFDPRYLAFEFVLGIVLRKRQVELVEAFWGAACKGESSVHQMLMGMGKTSVISPLLVLMLADRHSLVTQVVPVSLLNQTQDVLRARFSSIIQLQVSTLNFDRSSPKLNSVTKLEGLLDRVNRVRLDGGVLVTTPGAIKSVMLQFLDYLQATQASDSLLAVKPAEGDADGKLKRFMKAKQARSHSLMADVLRDIIRMWGPATQGKLLLDEVDLILNPLKSELNFPIGDKAALDCSPWRWEFAMHVLDAVFTACGKPLTQGASGQDIPVTPADEALLEELAATIEEGGRMLAVQRKPHFIVLQEQFYTSRLRPLLARWALSWFNFHSGRFLQEDSALDTDTMLSFLLEEYRVPDDVAAAATQSCTAEGMQAMNLMREWLNSVLFFCLTKVHRVSYGVLQPSDHHRLMLQGGGTQTESRLLNAVPFQGKDSPSQASEFAHPDVLIGLTILSFRYSGLRTGDVRAIITQLKKDLASEPGPFESRKSFKLFNAWTEAAAKRRAEKGSKSDDNAELLPLHLVQPADREQMSGLHEAIKDVPQAILYFMRVKAFPDTMQHQHEKLTASGVDLGSDMLFHTRLGFSGTPSDLLPVGLPSCQYELGSDAAMLRQLLRSDVVDTQELPPTWSVHKVLKRIANAHSPSVDALIDTGALVTGMSNLTVAKYLLKVGLPHKLGCVYLNSKDEKMVYVRDLASSVPLAQCGLAKDKLFVFFDQVHTTGMDIPQAVNARAVITLGKDMTLRDYAQGAWRMRGLGRGQTLVAMLTPEVLELVGKVLPPASDGSKPRPHDVRFGLKGALLAFLMCNSMKIEQLQHVALVEQNLAHTWRKPALVDLLNSSAPSDDDAGLVAFPDALRLLLDAGAAKATRKRRLKLQNAGGRHGPRNHFGGGQKKQDDDDEVDGVAADIVDQTVQALGYAADILETAADDRMVKDKDAAQAKEAAKEDGKGGGAAAGDDAAAEEEEEDPAAAAERQAEAAKVTEAEQRLAQFPCYLASRFSADEIAARVGDDASAQPPAPPAGTSLMSSMSFDGAGTGTAVPPPPAPTSKPGLTRHASDGAAAVDVSLRSDLRPGSTAGPWLGMCIKAFRDPLNLHVSKAAPKPVGFTAGLQEKRERRHLFISHTPGADAQADTMLQLAALTTGLASDDSGGDGAALQGPEAEAAALAVRRAFMSEMVLEHEKRKDEEKEKQKAQEKEIARLSGDDFGYEIPWKVLDLLVHPSRHELSGRGGTLFPLASLKMPRKLEEGVDALLATQERSTLAFPGHVYISDNHSNEQSFARCRLKNCSLSLMWTLPAQGMPSGEYMRLNQAVEKRHALQLNGKLYQYDDGRSDAYQGTDQADVAAEASALDAAADGSELDPHKALVVQLTLAEAETLRRAMHTNHPVFRATRGEGSQAAASLVTVDGWTLDFQAETKEDSGAAAGGAGLQGAMVTAESEVRCVPQLTAEQYVGMCALQYFNCDVWYSQRGLAEGLASWMAPLGSEAVVQFFNASATLRRRDRKAFADTLVEPVLINPADPQLAQNWALLQQAAAALAAQHGGSLAAAMAAVAGGDAEVKRAALLAAVKAAGVQGASDEQMLRTLWPSANVSLGQQHVLASLLGMDRADTRVFYASLCAAQAQGSAAAALDSTRSTLDTAVAHSPADMHRPKVVVGSVDDAAASTDAAKLAAAKREKAEAARAFRPVARNQRDKNTRHPWTLLEGSSLYVSSDGVVTSDVYADCGDDKEAAPTAAQEGEVWASVLETPLQGGKHVFEAVLRRRGAEVQVPLAVLEASTRLAQRREKEAKDAAVKEGKQDAQEAGADKAAEEEEEEDATPARVTRAKQRYADVDVTACALPAVGWLLWTEGSDLNDPHAAVKVTLDMDGKLHVGAEHVQVCAALAPGGQVVLQGCVPGGAGGSQATLQFVTAAGEVQYDPVTGSVSVSGQASGQVAPLSAALVAVLPVVSASAAGCFSVDLFLGGERAAHAAVADAYGEDAASSYSTALCKLYEESKLAAPVDGGADSLLSVPEGYVPVGSTLSWRASLQGMVSAGGLQGKLLNAMDNRVLKDFHISTSPIEYQSYVVLKGAQMLRGKYYYEFSFKSGAQGAMGFTAAPWEYDQRTQELLHDQRGFGIDGNQPSCSNTLMGSLFRGAGLSSSGRRFETGAVYSMAVDMDEGTVWYGVDGDYSAPNGAAYKHIGQHTLCGVIMSAMVYASTEMTFNVGQTPFKHSAPGPGYKAVLGCMEGVTASLQRMLQGQEGEKK